MLEKCAPGHTVYPGKHKYIVMYGGLEYPDLQKGDQHGKGEVQLNSVEKMVQVLKIDLPCAKKWCPQIRTKVRPN